MPNAAVPANSELVKQFHTSPVNLSILLLMSSSNHSNIPSDLHHTPNNANFDNGKTDINIINNNDDRRVRALSETYSRQCQHTSTQM
jgi:hypothetical protein